MMMRWCIEIHKKAKKKTTKIILVKRHIGAIESGMSALAL